jgi:hypothetical protein
MPDNLSSNRLPTPSYDDLKPTTLADLASLPKLSDT